MTVMVSEFRYSKQNTCNMWLFVMMRQNIFRRLYQEAIEWIPQLSWGHSSLVSQSDTIDTDHSRAGQGSLLGSDHLSRRKRRMCVSHRGKKPLICKLQSLQCKTSLKKILIWPWKRFSWREGRDHRVSQQVNCSRKNTSNLIFKGHKMCMPNFA